MNDPRRDPELLRVYLLGGEYRQAQDIKGLLQRTRMMASNLDKIPVPSMKAGSIVGSSGVNHMLEKEALIRLSGGPDVPLLALIDLAHYLDSWLGSYGERTVKLSHLFDRASSRVWDLLDPRKMFVSDEDLDACLDLGTGLVEWAGTSCIHNFRPQTDDEEFRAVCEKCNFFFDQVAWVSTVPLARCEVCEEPIDRKANGRSRHTCSDRCRQSLSRQKERAA